MSLIAQYKLNGNAIDSISGNNGIATDMVWGNGKLGQCGVFNGTGWIDCGNLGQTFRGSISLWFQKDNINTEYLLDGRLTGNWWFLTHYQGSDITFLNRVVYNGLNLNQWYHVVVTATPKETKLYINGDLVSTGAGLEIDFRSVRIGTRYSNSDYLNGLMDDVRIYDHALSLKEVKDLSKGLALYYPFDRFAEPTKNEIEVDLTLYAKDNGATVTLQPYTYNGNPVYRVTFPEGTLPRIRTNFDYVDGETFTGHIFHRVVDRGTLTPQLFFRESGFGTTYAAAHMSEDRWTQVEIKHTFAGSGTCMFLLYVSSSSTTVPTTMDFTMPQVEKKPHATTFTPSIREGVVIDSSSQGNDAVLDLSTTPKWVDDPVVGGAYDLNGVDQFIEVSDTNTQFNVGDMSFSVQSKSTGTRDASKYIICHYNWRIRWVDDTTIGFQCGRMTDNTGPTFIIQHDMGNQKNQWNHYVGVYKPSIDQMYLYVNGVLVGQSSMDGLELHVDYSRDIRIGTSYHGNVTFYAGLVSKVRVFKEALTNDQVLSLYQQHASLDSKGNFYA